MKDIGDHRRIENAVGEWEAVHVSFNEVRPAGNRVPGLLQHSTADINPDEVEARVNFGCTVQQKAGATTQINNILTVFGVECRQRLVSAFFQIAAPPRVVGAGKRRVFFARRIDINPLDNVVTPGFDHG